ncbi:MAG: PQQ-dependent sugar dehydrogenase [Planctomycetota bacterium]
MALSVAMSRRFTGWPAPPPAARRPRRRYPERLFAVAREGRIDVVRDGGMLAEPCLDLSKLVRTAGNEQGLLGLAFHPDFKSTGYFYVNDTREHNGRTVIGRYEISADPDIASPDRR